MIERDLHGFVESWPVNIHEMWNDLSDDERKEYLEYYYSTDFSWDWDEAHEMHREFNIASYAYTDSDEEDSFFVADWFHSYGRQISNILKDEDQEYTNPNLEAARRAANMLDHLQSDIEGLVTFLLRKKEVKQ